jgi:hypothetical protein
VSVVRAVISTLVRIDARRPAAWIAFGSAMAAAAALPSVATMRPALAIACGGLTAVAGVGGLPAGMAADVAAWVGLGRLAWPIGGAVVGTAIAGLAGAPPVGCWAGAFMIATAIATGWAVCRAAHAGIAPAEAASLPLLMTAAAACAAAIPESLTWSAIAAFVCFATLAGIAAGAAPLVRGGHSWPSVSPGSDGHRGTRAIRSEHGDPVSVRAHGSKHASPLDRLAMASALGSMVVCYFLAPEYAWVYAVISATWFVALAGPAATIAAGPRDAGRRGLLVRSAAGGPRLPGSLAHALTAIGFYAAVLGWPAVVAALLRGGAAAASRGPLEEPLAAIALLAMLAGGMAAIVAVVTLIPDKAGQTAFHSGGTTALAVVMVAALVAMLAIGVRLPGRPSLRSSPPTVVGEIVRSRC